MNQKSVSEALEIALDNSDLMAGTMDCLVKPKLFCVLEHNSKDSDCDSQFVQSEFFPALNKELALEFARSKWPSIFLPMKVWWLMEIVSKA